MAKYGMSMCVLGMSEEFKSDGIAVNALWPRTGMLARVHLMHRMQKGIARSPNYFLAFFYPLKLCPFSCSNFYCCDGDAGRKRRLSTMQKTRYYG